MSKQQAILETILEAVWPIHYDPLHSTRCLPADSSQSAASRMAGNQILNRTLCVIFGD